VIKLKHLKKLYTPIKFKSTIGSTSKVWDKVSKNYDKSRLTDPVYKSCVSQTISTAFKRGGAKRCIDAGCGTGITTIEITKFCDCVVAVDYSYSSLCMLKKKSNGKVILVQADITKLPFKDNIFDTSICANTLQHLQPGYPQRSAIGELIRITKNNCRLIVSIHHYSNNKRKAGWIKEGKPGQPGIDYIFRFTRSDIIKLLPGSVVRGIGFYGFARIPFFGSRLQNIIGKMVGRLAAIVGYGHMLTAEYIIKKI